MVDFGSCTHTAVVPCHRAIYDGARARRSRGFASGICMGFPSCCGLCTCPQVHILILWRCHVAIQIVACGSCQMPTAVQHRQRGWDPLRRCVVLPRQCIWTLPPYLGCVAHHNTLNGLVPIFWVGGLGDLSRNINTNTFPAA